MIAAKMIYVGLAAVVTLAVGVGWKMTARSGYESAEYTVVESDGPIEIREYSDLTLATTYMQFESQGDDGSFMRLFQYISGGNSQKQKVAMTIPVFVDRESNESPGQMGFVMPQQVIEHGVPEPLDERVQLETRTGGRFAAIRFAGRTDSGSLAEAELKLRAWIRNKGLAGSSVAEVAGYDPPWTPGPFRRNEILIRLDPE